MEPSILVNCLFGCVFILVVSFEYISSLNADFTSWHFDPIYHVAWEVVKIRYLDHLDVVTGKRTSYAAYKGITL